MSTESGSFQASNTIVKYFFGYVRSQQTVKDNLTTLRTLNGELTTTDQETADLLSTHFQTVYTVEDTSNLPVVKISNDADLNFDELTVMRKLLNLNPDKSSGPDDIHPMLLKECAAAVTKPLSIIFQQSFDTKTLLADWKKTVNIVPIFKKGDRTDRSNCHPVSLTSVPCKIMESIIKEKLKYLDGFK